MTPELLIACGIAVVVLVALYIAVFGAKKAQPEQAPQRSKPASAAPSQEAPPKGKPQKKEVKEKKVEHELTIATLKGHSEPLTCATFSPNGKFLATAAEDRTIRVYHKDGYLEKNPVFARINLEIDHASSISFNSNGGYIVAALANTGSLAIYSIKYAKKDPNAKAKSVLYEKIEKTSFSDTLKQLHKADIKNVCFSPDNTFILTCSGDVEAKLWDLKGTCLHTVNTGQISNNMAAISREAKFFSIAARTSEAKVWEVASDKDGKLTVQKVMSLTGHTKEVRCVAFNGDTTMAATCSKDGTWRLFNINVRYMLSEDPKLLKEARIGTGSHWDIVSLSPTNQWLLAACGGDIHMFRLPSGELWKVIEGAHSEDIMSISWCSNEGNTFLSAGADRVVRIWDLP